MNTLEFDIAKLKSTKKKCEDLASELKTLKDSLLKDLTNLRKEWNTPAGETFFAEQNTDWTSQVNSYVEITKAIGELLGVAISEFESLTDEAKAIKLS